MFLPGVGAERKQSKLDHDRNLSVCVRSDGQDSRCALPCQPLSAGGMGTGAGALLADVASLLSLADS